MEKRGVTEVDVRAMLERATRYEPSVVDGHFMSTRFISSLACPAEARLGNAGERRLVAQIFTSWNRIADWLRRIEALHRAR
jgi:hypothetical protein